MGIERDIEEGRGRETMMRIEREREREDSGEGG